MSAYAKAFDRAVIHRDGRIRAVTNFPLDNYDTEVLTAVDGLSWYELQDQIKTCSTNSCRKEQLAIKFDQCDATTECMFSSADGARIVETNADPCASLKDDKRQLYYTLVQGSFNGLYLGMSTLVLIFLASETGFFMRCFPTLKHVQAIRFRKWTSQYGPNDKVLHSAVYLQSSIIGQAIIFCTRSRFFCFMKRPSVRSRTRKRGVVYEACVVWVWDFLWFVPIDVIKIFIRCSSEGDWSNMLWKGRSQIVGVKSMSSKSG